MPSEKQPLTIWTNVDLPAPLAERLRVALAGHRVLHAAATTPNNLAGAAVDPNLEHADVAFGQPEPGQITQLPRLRWVQLTTAGYTRYDTKEFRDTVRRHGTVICNASSVYAEPCAQHVLAMMLALVRKLPQSLDNQRGPHAWPAPVASPRW